MQRAFINIYFLVFCFFTNELFASSACQLQLLLEQPSISITQTVDDEARYYLTHEQAEAFKLRVVDGKLINMKGEIFNTHGSKASLVVNDAGDIFATTFRKLGVFHHSTLVAGAPVKLSIELIAEESGRIPWLSYRSGHYPHGPWRLKLFLLYLQQNKVHCDTAKIALSDCDSLTLSGSGIPIAMFLEQSTTSDLKGNDLVLAYYLYSGPDVVSVRRDSEFNFFTQALHEINYFLYDPKTINSALVTGRFTQSFLFESLLIWFESSIVRGSNAELDIVVNTIPNLRKQITANPNSWHAKFLAALFEKFPQLQELETEYRKGFRRRIDVLE